ncbi:MAG: hypothetical protein IJA98_00115 [Bacteroidaceae bacterium]|nr:hypothetical protein [Bacteroidaceae bacterium]
MTHLLPPALDKYFAIKHFNHSMSKDDRLALTELALIDLEELDNMRPEAVNLLKTITTDPAINLRPVWERYALRRQHIASFCGTGNNPRFLTDLSGNRRWHPSWWRASTRRGSAPPTTTASMHRPMRCGSRASATGLTMRRMPSWSSTTGSLRSPTSRKSSSSPTCASPTATRRASSSLPRASSSS